MRCLAALKRKAAPCEGTAFQKRNETIAVPHSSRNIYTNCHVCQRRAISLVSEVTL
jgi:hypothetical protein